MKEVDWTKFGDARKRDGLLPAIEHVCADGEDETRNTAAAPEDKVRDGLNEPVVGKGGTDPIDVHEVVDVHGAISDDQGERFVAGETVAVDGVVCGYEGVPGDAGDDPPRLRIVDVAGGCKCQTCEATDRKEDGDKCTYFRPQANLAHPRK